MCRRRPFQPAVCRSFLAESARKYNNNRRGSLLAFGGKGAFRKAVARKDWPVVFKLGPDLLKTNPWEVSTLRGLAEAAAAIGAHDVELRYLKNALDANPKDAEVNKHCAISLARIGQFDQAISCWQRVDEAKRGDLEAQRMITELQKDKIERDREEVGPNRAVGVELLRLRHHRPNCKRLQRRAAPSDDERLN